eukprot:1144091-Pelagomonas_calceolata.AAC.2
MQSQGIRIITSVFVFNGTSGRGELVRIMHSGHGAFVQAWYTFVGRSLAFKLIQGMGSIERVAHTQEDCVESDLGTLKLFAQFTVLSL